METRRDTGPYAAVARVRAAGPIRIRARVAFGPGDLATASFAAFLGGWLIGWLARFG